MIKNFAGIEVTKEDRVYQLLCAFNAPLGEVLDVLVQMKALVVEQIIAAQEKEKPQEEKKDGTSS